MKDSKLVKMASNEETGNDNINSFIDEIDDELEEFDDLGK